MKLETAQQRVKDVAEALEAAHKQMTLADWAMEAHFERLHRLEKRLRNARRTLAKKQAI